mgnify:CR=1 FL=1
MWVVRSLIVVPTFYLYGVAEYNPTWVEWALILGCYVFAAILYLALCRFLPALELPGDLRMPKADTCTSEIPSWRVALIVITIIAGIAFIILGISRRHEVPAAPIWILGIFLLVTVPLQICLRRVRQLATAPQK